MRMIGNITNCIPLQTQLMQVMLGHLYTTDTPEVQQTENPTTDPCLYQKLSLKYVLLQN